MGAVHLAATDFEKEVLQAEVPVLVDFFAEWCGPCKMLSPIIDEIADEMGGKAKIVKVDVDEAQEIASRYGVMSIPTLIIFKNGEVSDQIVGLVPKDQIVAKLNA